MRMDPDSSKLFRTFTEIDLVFKKVGDRSVIKCYGHFSAALLNNRYVRHVKQIFCIRNPKSTHFGRARITQKQ
ncbi:MAG: hypothetical protein CMJ47_02800 [Planctomyces sp.]|nr:hypothetical protein [Planctomyces sp.]